MQALLLLDARVVGQQQAEPVLSAREERVLEVELVE